MTTKRLAQLASWLTGVFLLARLTIDRAANPQDHSLGWAIGTVRHWLRVDMADPQEMQALWFWWGDEHDAPYSYLLEWPYDNALLVAGLCSVIAWSAVLLLDTKWLTLFLGSVLALCSSVFAAAFLQSHLTIFYTDYARNAFYLEFAWLPLVSMIGLALNNPPESTWRVSLAFYEYSNAVGKCLFGSSVLLAWSTLVWISVRSRSAPSPPPCRSGSQPLTLSPHGRNFPAPGPSRIVAANPHADQG